MNIPCSRLVLNSAQVSAGLGVLAIVGDAVAVGDEGRARATGAADAVGVGVFIGPVVSVGTEVGVSVGVKVGTPVNVGTISVRLGTLVDAAAGILGGAVAQPIRNPRTTNATQPRTKPVRVGA